MLSEAPMKDFVDAEPVAWRHKERVNDDFDTDWILTKNEPPDGVRVIAKEPLYASPPQPVAVPEGWKLVPVEPTQAMVLAIPFPNSVTPRFGVETYRAMLAAAPAAPAQEEPT